MEYHNTLEHTLYWLQAIRFQGERTLLSEKLDGSLTHQTITRMEEQFFLNAVNKSIRWANELKSLNCCVQELEIFLSISSFTNLVRNKREHDDEYFGPEKKNAKMTKLPKEENKPQIIIGQSMTMHRNGKILLGGTVDIHDVIAKAEKLIPILIDLQHQYWENRSLGDINNVKHFFAPDNLISKNN